MDFLGRYETLQTSYDEVCRLAGIPSRPLERRRRPELRDWRQYYDAELTELVADFYREDLENFGYAFEPDPLAGV